MDRTSHGSFAASYESPWGTIGQGPLVRGHRSAATGHGAGTRVAGRSTTCDGAMGYRVAARTFMPVRCAGGAVQHQSPPRLWPLPCSR